jgi:hypothetical protein
MCVLTNVHGGSEELDESECWHLFDVDLRQSDPGDGVAFTSLKIPNSPQSLNGTEDHGACALTLMFSRFCL